MMVQDMKLIAIVLILAALVYILYLWSKRKDQIPCPSCGARVNIYAEECPHCGHQKGEPVEDEETAEDDAEATSDDTTAESDASPDTDAQPAPAVDVDYDAVVQGTITEVKERMEDDNLNPQQVLEAEKANKNRVTLKDWLEEQFAAQ